ncbi:MAG: choice-of-anchor J domain-containing protein, partial [bacterium]|nr:choice-of-anchor J domain-containing protein [bacterium]
MLTVKPYLVAVALFCMAVSGLGVTLLSQGFNDPTIPAGWATEIVNDPGIDPALAYVTTSANPAGFAPYEGTRFVQFNSYDCPSGAVIRLKYTNGFSTIGYASLKVQCAWTEDNEYSANPDFVTLQWSTDGTVWNSFTNYYRYNAAGDAWSPKTIDLPAGALNQPNVMLAFAFNSRYGNDCHLDAVQVSDQAPNVYVLPTTQSRPGLPGDVLPYIVTVTNLTGASTAFNLFYRNANWSESGPAITPTLTAGAATSFVVTATVPLAGLPNAANTAMVVAIQGSYSNSAVLASQCIWSKTIMDETFATYTSTNGWASYFLASPQLGWFWSTASGNPQPSLRHGDVTVTGIVSNWIVTPALSLPNANQIQFSCDFIPFVTAPRTYYYTGAFISKGNRNPASNDYVEIAPCSGVPGYLNPVSADISQYRGNANVYIGFLYIGTNSHRAYVDNVKIVASVTGVDNAQLAGPSPIILTSYQATAVITGLLYAAGQTGGPTPAPYFSGQIGYGERGTAPGSSWVWFDAPCVGAAQSNDVYARAIPITMAGQLDVAVRFCKAGGPWTYGDLDGSSNGYSSAQAIKATAICPPPLGSLVYQQAMAPPGLYYFSSYLSPPTTNIAADDFTCASNLFVQTVRWTGYYPYYRAGNETGFWLRMYADAPADGIMPYSHPGQTLLEEFHPGYNCELSTNILWYYQADLQAPFFAQAGSTYWFAAELQC